MKTTTPTTQKEAWLKVLHYIQSKVNSRTGNPLSTAKYYLHIKKCLFVFPFLDQTCNFYMKTEVLITSTGHQKKLSINCLSFKDDFTNYNIARYIMVHLELLFGVENHLKLADREIIATNLSEK